MSSNIVRRLKTAAIAIPIVLGGLYFPYLILLICLVVCFVGLCEFAALRTEILNNLYQLISSSHHHQHHLLHGTTSNTNTATTISSSALPPSSLIAPGSGPDIVSHVQIGMGGTNGLVHSIGTVEKAYPTEDRRVQTLIRCLLGTSLLLFAFFSTDERHYTFANYSLFEFGLSTVFLITLLWGMLSAGAPDAIPDAQQLAENGVFTSTSSISTSSTSVPAAAAASGSGGGGAAGPVHMPLSMRTFIEMAFDLFGMLYLAVSISFGIMLYNKSVALFTLVLLCNWAGDAAALFVGRSIGRHKLYPKISPNKTIEGFCGALMGAVLSGTLFFYIWETFFAPSTSPSSSSSSSLSSSTAIGAGLTAPLFRVEEFMVIGLMVGVLGAAGDLVKSYMKRVARVKDAGNFFGAHGGVIDRIDGLLFAFGPVYFLYLFMMS